MQDTLRYNEELNKVKMLLSKYEKKNRVSNMLLFRDYLNKLYDWKALYGDNNKVIAGKGKAYHNLFLNMDAKWLSELKSFEDFSKDIKQFGLNLKGGRHFDEMFVFLFVYWNLYSNSSEIIEANLPNPYESSILIIQRCEYMYTHNGLMQIDDFTFNNAEKYYSYKLPSLEPEFLDYIDSKSTKPYDIDIPNQERTNQYWIDFQSLNRGLWYTEH